MNAHPQKLSHGNSPAVARSTGKATATNLPTLSTLHIASVLREQPYPAQAGRLGSDEPTALAPASQVEPANGLEQSRSSHGARGLSNFSSHDGYAEQIASRARLEACGGDQDLFLKKECERLDVLFADAIARCKASEQRTRDWIAGVEGRQ